MCFGKRCNKAVEHASCHVHVVHDTPTSCALGYHCMTLLASLAHPQCPLGMLLTCGADLQQADVLRKHTSLQVSQYCGDMNVDYWDGHRWTKELREQDVWVMTPQILLNILRHGFIRVFHLSHIQPVDTKTALHWTAASVLYPLDATPIQHSDPCSYTA